MLTVEEVFTLVNNLEAREPIRRCAPRWAVVVVDKTLQVVAVERYKERSELCNVDVLMAKHLGCAYFHTHPGMYPSIESLGRKISDCADAFNVDWGDRGDRADRGQ